MLSTVLQKLETLFSKRMLLSAFYPLLVTVFLNLVLLHRASPRFRTWLASRDPALNVETLISGTVIAFAIAVAAFFLSTINLHLRRVIEGYEWPEWLCRLAVPIQNERLAKLEAELQLTTGVRRGLLRVKRTFENRLNNARKLGRDLTPPRCVYPNRLSAIATLITKRQNDCVINANELDAAAAALVAVLQVNSADLAENHPQANDSRRLDADHVALEELLQYANDRAVQDVVDAFARRESAFGDHIVEPTAAGNMVRAVSSYAQRRYGFSMDLLWTRLQQAMQGQSFYETVLDAKAELDSLIALFWLTGVTWIGWWIGLAVAATSPWTFLALAFAGPLSSWLLHRLILASYVSFNDLLRASVDLYRFKVLEAMHIALPDGPTSEKRIWETVTTHNAYGETLNLPYHHGTTV